MPRYLPAAFASNADVRAGRLDEALRQVLALPFPEPPPTNGAAVAADRIAGGAVGCEPSYSPRNASPFIAYFLMSAWCLRKSSTLALGT